MKALIDGQALARRIAIGPEVQSLTERLLVVRPAAAADGLAATLETAMRLAPFADADIQAEAASNAVLDTAGVNAMDADHKVIADKGIERVTQARSDALRYRQKVRQSGNW